MPDLLRLAARRAGQAVTVCFTRAAAQCTGTTTAYASSPKPSTCMTWAEHPQPTAPI
ncbi:hypothetical protein OG777_04600 [Micromonospora peucetia]|uniref:hypothetical protein n=1 Tax=Micromonospora peucetia TaxID=47871 RepID=UPI002254D19D|nr:hypothetical protein [Micromonospora peucetia]MCX4386206.1 hypothetical protein [Micromonospora peucetia]